jgi:hypothetical protein
VGNREDLLETVNFLVTDPSASRHYEALLAVLKVSHLQIKFTGEMAGLNPLLDMYRDDPSALQRVIELVDDKRTKRGWEPLQKVENGFDRNQYQREFMHQKRNREKRIADIENMSRPEKDKLIGQARIEFIRRHSNTWKKRRDALLAAARKEHGGPLSQDQMKRVLEQFWETIDQELDEAEAGATRKIRGW